MQTISKNKIMYVCNGCMKVVEPKGLKMRPIKCDKRGCGEVALNRVCPECHPPIIRNGRKIIDTATYKKIPEEVLYEEKPYFPLSIVGVTGSGKTNYITVMLEYLPRDATLGISVRSLNDEARQRQSNNLDKINEHVTPDPTPNAKPEPQIWKISKTLRKESWKTSWKTPTSFAFTIYDGAGEQVQGETRQNIISYIGHSEAIIITVDPLGLDNIRMKLDPDDVKNSQRDTGKSYSANSALDFIIGEIKKSKNTEKLGIPTAIVLTKFDTILKNDNFRDFLGNNFEESETTFRDGKLYVGIIKEASDLIEGLLNKFGEDNFVKKTKQYFENFMFFGVSCYGKPPKDNHTLNGDIKPHRVCDPILWLFYKKNLIGSYEEVN